MKKKLWLSAALLAGAPALVQAQWGITDIYNNVTNYESDWGEYVTLGTDGNIYVASTRAGSSEDGQFIKLSLSWSGDIVTSTSSVLQDFSDSTYGIESSAPVVEDANGNFFGTSSLGAGANANGVVWEYSSSGTMSVIYQFLGGSTDACDPNNMTLVQGTADTVILYGEANGCTGTVDNVGAIFKLKGLPGTATSWKMKILYEFTGGTTDGDEPSGGLLLGSDGNLYGTTHEAGASGDGLIFSIDTSGGTLNDIASFPDSSGPSGGGLVERDAGDTVMFVGERFRSGSDGVIYEVVNVGGGGFTYSTVHDFKGGLTDGANPGRNLIYSPVLDYFFGTTGSGGAHGGGTFYSLTPSGTFTILNSLSYGEEFNLIWGPTTCEPCTSSVTHGGGTNDYGVVWMGIQP